MTDTAPDEGTAQADPIAQAIDALTTAARQTRVRGAGTEHAAVEPVDFGEIVCHVITAVAANVGGIERLLAGRPSSWEADYVRQIVHSTAGDDDEALLRYRTEPVRLALDVEDVFQDFGLYDLYEEARDELGRREEQADEAMFEAVATDEERARIEDIHAAMPPLGSTEEGDRERAIALMEEARTITEAIAQRAAEAGEPLAAALATATSVSETVDELWERDQAAYREAYIVAVRQDLTARGLMVGVEAVEWSAVSAEEWDPFTDELHEHARKTAPLPMTGAAPDWTEGTPADALRRAGLTYTARAQEAV